MEDTDSNFKLMRVILLSAGAGVDRAINGKQAIQMIFSEMVYDLIIMDIKLPGNDDGYDVTRKIREKDKNIPIVANTAYAIIGEKEKAIEAGCNAYIVKPTIRPLLLNTITELIQNSHGDMN